MTEAPPRIRIVLVEDHFLPRFAVTTLIQETSPDARAVEDKRAELAATPSEVVLSADEVSQLREIGDNTGSMTLKGGVPDHAGEERPDRWALTPELAAAGERWGIEAERDLVAVSG